MTFPRPSRVRSKSGFTLVELLVALGIIVLLIGILLTGAFAAWKNGKRIRMKADIQILSNALEQYYYDFSSYPQNNPGGATVMVQALMGPYDKAVDGADGAGFRTIRRVADGVAGPDRSPTTADTFDGRVWGPYLPPERFRIDKPFTFNAGLSKTTNPTQNTDVDTVNNEFLFFLDSADNRVYYWPRSEVQANISLANGYCAIGTAAIKPMFDFNWNGPNNMTTANAKKYVAFLDAADAASTTAEQMQGMLGDYSCDGKIDSTLTPPESALWSGPFLLWSAGPDNIMGPVDTKGKVVAKLASVVAPDTWRRCVERADDVTNFRD